MANTGLLKTLNMTAGIKRGGKKGIGFLLAVKEFSSVMGEKKKGGGDAKMDIVG